MPEENFSGQAPERVETEENLLGWMIVEVKGHRKLAGRVTETTLAGHGVIRVDVPGEGDAVILTQLYPPDSIHCLTYCTEAEARRQAAMMVPAPAKRIEARFDDRDDFDGDHRYGYGGEDEDDEDEVTF